MDINLTIFSRTNYPTPDSGLYTAGTLQFDEGVYSDVQSGCVDLDKFVHALIMKCPSDLVTVLVDTVQKRLSIVEDTPDDAKESEFIARRLIRAVARLFVVLCVEASSSTLSANLSIGTGPALTTLSAPTSATSASAASSRAAMSPTKAAINSRLARFKSLSSSSTHQHTSAQVASLVTISPIAKCEYILRQFAKYSVQELADSAHSLIMPVVLGVAKPATFKLSSTGSGADYLSVGGGGFSNQYALAEDVFNVETPMHRQLSSSVSTTLITPVKRPVTPAEAGMAKSCGFRNTFESVRADKKAIPVGSDGRQVDLTSMPPPIGEFLCALFLGRFH